MDRDQGQSSFTHGALECQSKIDKLMAESNSLWQTFSATRCNYQSVIKVNGHYLPPPVVSGQLYDIPMTY